MPTEAWIGLLAGAGVGLTLTAMAMTAHLTVETRPATWVKLSAAPTFIIGITMIGAAIGWSNAL